MAEWSANGWNFMSEGGRSNKTTTATTTSIKRSIHGKTTTEEHEENGTQGVSPEMSHAKYIKDVASAVSSLAISNKNKTIIQRDYSSFQKKITEQHGKDLLEHGYSYCVKFTI